MVSACPITSLLAQYNRYSRLIAYLQAHQFAQWKHFVSVDKVQMEFSQRLVSATLL